MLSFNKCVFSAACTRNGNHCIQGTSQHPQNATINVVIANGEEFENIPESWSQMYYRTGTDLFEVKVPKSYLEARAIAQAGSESKVKMKFILNGDFDNYALETTGNMAPAELPAYNDNVPTEGDVSKEFVKSKQFIALADPQIFFHENNYYLYGTLSGGRGLKYIPRPTSSVGQVRAE